LRYVCQHNQKNKVDKDENKRGFSINTKCSAFIKMEIKKVTKWTEMTDPLLKVSEV